MTGADQLLVTVPAETVVSCGAAVQPARIAPAVLTARFGVTPLPRVTGADQVPPARKIAAWMDAAELPELAHNVTASPAASTATCGLMPAGATEPRPVHSPGPSVTGAVQVCPSALVETLTPAVPDVMAAAAPEVLTAAAGGPPEMGRGTGADANFKPGQTRKRFTSGDRHPAPILLTGSRIGR